MEDRRLKLMIDPDKIEEGAWKQISATLSCPYVDEMIVLPDVHQGYSFPIGCAVSINDYICPAGVGFDIGCGMSHVNTKEEAKEFDLFDPEIREIIYNEITKRIPVGFNSRKEPIEHEIFNPESIPRLDEGRSRDKLRSKMQHQLGTLGGGNHFIELGVNQAGELGITIHSGSRNPGHTIAEYWMKLAEKEGLFQNVDYMFPILSANGIQYLSDLYWTEKYAYLNRKIMMYEIFDALGLDIDESRIINESHNHAFVDERRETIIHRKGATPASLNQWGVIPSNQRDGVYVTKGLGNPHYLSSASHGAGRVMSRKKAKKNLSLEKTTNDMYGITAQITKDNLDEAPDAYKNIEDVLSYQDGTVVRVEDHFKPLIVIKG